LEFPKFLEIKNRKYTLPISFLCGHGQNSKKFKKLKQDPPHQLFLLKTTILFKKNNKKPSILFVLVLFFEFPGWPSERVAKRKYGFRIWGDFPLKMA